MSDKPEIPWYVRWMIIADVALLVKVFLRPTWWMDRRWHVNQYDLAAHTLIVALAMCLAANALAFTTNLWFVAIWGTVASMGIIYMYSHYLKLLAAASRDYERDPSQITRPQAFFSYITLPPLRFVMIIVGTQVAALSIPLVWKVPEARLILRLILGNWMWLIGAALYIAGVPRTPHQRRPKKERARQLLTAAPLGSPT
jgi:hypothetical protein